MIIYRNLDNKDGKVSNHYTIYVNKEGFLDILILSKLLKINIRASLDLIEKVGGIVNSYTGHIFFSKKQDIEKLMGIVNGWTRKGGV